MQTHQMTEEELRGLPVSVDLVTAGRAFGLGRTVSHELARAEEFPCRVLRVGARYRVLKADLLQALGVDPAALVPAQPPPPDGGGWDALDGPIEEAAQ